MTKLPFSWPSSIPALIPHRMRRKLRSKVRSRQSPASSFASLETSISPADTLQALRSHRWSFYDGQYVILVILGIFTLCIIPAPGPLVKTGASTLLLASLIIPATRQFFLPLLPVITWLDIMAWLPYGIMDYASPIVCSGIVFIFASPGTLPVFARSLGYMNLIAVSIQLMFPCSPPWYENLYGLAPANYSIHGSPAGLARIDELFGIALYTPSFNGSPMVFGAFPSLHAGWATMVALVLSHVFPRLRPVFIGYTLWIWWATMYLSHHYAVDLVGGSLREWSLR